MHINILNLLWILPITAGIGFLFGTLFWLNDESDDNYD